MVRKETILILMGFILVFLATVATAVVIPFFGTINQDLGIQNIGLIEAFHIIMATIATMLWGVFADRYDRRLIVLGSTVLWTGSGVALFVLPPHIISYTFFRGLMGLGVGAALPLIYSILGDSAGIQERGKYSSGLSVVVIVGAGSGIIIGAILENIGWQGALLVLSLAGLLTIGPFFFYQVPARGAQEPELLASDGLLEYNYRIELPEIKEILLKPTNFWLLLQGLFALIPSTTFSYYLVNFFADYRYGGLFIPLSSATILALGFASGRIIGYVIFGPFGDRVAKSVLSNKARLMALGIGLQTPLSIVAFVVISHYQLNIQSGNIFDYLLIPELVIFGLLFFSGTLTGGAAGPNRRALLYDVNLPEHRGTTGAMFTITDQLGSAVALIGASLLLPLSGYIWLFLITSLFYMISALVCIPVIYHVEIDSQTLREVIQKRASIRISHFSVEEDLRIF
ncbi:MAG: MFS transporter [Promethearchaeota archaeon]